MKISDEQNQTTVARVAVGSESYVGDRLGNTLAVVMGEEHVWIDVLLAGVEPTDPRNWHQVATLLPHQARALIELLSAAAATLENQHGQRELNDGPRLPSQRCQIRWNC